MNMSVNIDDDKTTTPVDNVTDGGVAMACEWFAATVHMNCERRVAGKLTAMGIENFVASQWEIHDWSDRRKRIERLLIPMIVFVRTTDDGLQRLRRMPMVGSVLSNPGSRRPAAIPADQIDRFRSMLNLAESPVRIEKSPLSAGATVRVVKGKLRGFVGELQEMPDKSSKIIVRLGCLGCASVQLPLSHVERVNI